MKLALVGALAFLLTLSSACTPDDDPKRSAPTKSSASPSPALTGGPGPYVSVAVDNHFHDVHPVDLKEIDGDEAFVVRNEGSNLHNVTFPGTKISEDIKPGQSWRIDPVRKLGGLGTYKFFCSYHADQGMRGVFTLVEEPS